MVILSAAEWFALCKEDNKLQVSLRRHIHRVDSYVVKIDLLATDPDVYGDYNDPRITRLLSENAKAATALVSKHTSIPVPQFVEDGVYCDKDGVARYYSVWGYIEGVLLEDIWISLSTEKKQGLLQQLRDFIVQLKRVPNPYSQKFAVGTLCSTGELLNDPGNPEKGGSFWRHNGPFKTVEDYRDAVKELYSYEPSFTPKSPATFDHMDWFTCNVLVDGNAEQIVGLLDWEKAGFIPDPRDNFLRGAAPEVKQRNVWLTLFDD